jgi:hypothetical protein
MVTAGVAAVVYLAIAIARGRQVWRPRSPVSGLTAAARAGTP